MKVSKGQSQPEVVAAAFLALLHGSGFTIFVPGFDCDSIRVLVLALFACHPPILYLSSSCILFATLPFSTCHPSFLCLLLPLCACHLYMFCQLDTSAFPLHFARAVETRCFD